MQPTSLSKQTLSKQIPCSTFLQGGEGAGSHTNATNLGLPSTMVLCLGLGACLATAGCLLRAVRRPAPPALDGIQMTPEAVPA